MLLLIPGVVRARCVALILLMIALTASMGMSKASAVDETVSVSPGETSCYYMHRRVLNPTSQWVAVMVYEIRNGVREDYAEVQMVAPRSDYFVKTDDKHYFQHALGVKTVALTGESGSAPVGDWTDWGATDYTLPSDCPQMFAPVKILKRTAKATGYRHPTIWVRVDSYLTDFGYRVSKSKKIRWVEKGMDARFGTIYGPSIEAGERTLIRFYSRNVDDSGRRTKPDYLGKLRIKRLR